MAIYIMDVSGFIQELRCREDDEANAGLAADASPRQVTLGAFICKLCLTFLQTAKPLSCVGAAAAE